MSDQGGVVYRGDELARSAELRAALDAELPDFVLIRRLVEQAYTTETGEAPTDKALASWIRAATRTNPNFRGLTTDRPFRRYVMYPAVADKFEYLIQRPCNLCLPYQRVDFIRFFLHTPPVSRQVKRSRAFKNAVRDYLNRVNHDFTDFLDARLCVAILFAFGTRGRWTDLDNPAKILLDSLESYAYKNDRQIDHLDIVRGRTGTVDSFIGIRIAVTEIAENVDTLMPELDVRWVPREGVGEIDLTPYLAKKRGR